LGVKNGGVQQAYKSFDKQINRTKEQQNGLSQSKKVYRRQAENVFNSR